VTTCHHLPISVSKWTLYYDLVVVIVHQGATTTLNHSLPDDQASNYIAALAHTTATNPFIVSDKPHHTDSMLLDVVVKALGSHNNKLLSCPVCHERGTLVNKGYAAGGGMVRKKMRFKCEGPCQSTSGINVSNIYYLSPDDNTAWNMFNAGISDIFTQVNLSDFRPDHVKAADTVKPHSTFPFYIRLDEEFASHAREHLIANSIPAPPPTQLPSDQILLDSSQPDSPFAAHHPTTLQGNSVAEDFMDSFIDFSNHDESFHIVNETSSGAVKRTRNPADDSRSTRLDNKTLEVSQDATLFQSMETMQKEQLAPAPLDIEAITTQIALKVTQSIQTTHQTFANQINSAVEGANKAMDKLGTLERRLDKLEKGSMKVETVIKSQVSLKDFEPPEQAPHVAATPARLEFERKHNVRLFGFEYFNKPGFSAKELTTFVKQELAKIGVFSKDIINVSLTNVSTQTLELVVSATKSGTVESSFRFGKMVPNYLPTPGPNLINRLSRQSERPGAPKNLAEIFGDFAKDLGLEIPRSATPAAPIGDLAEARGPGADQQ